MLPSASSTPSSSRESTPFCAALLPARPMCSRWVSSWSTAARGRYGCAASRSLAGREFDLAVRLASDPHRVFTKDELLRDVWGYRGRLVTRTVDSHASRLRNKLRAAGAELPYVMNVWGRGYRLLE